MSETLEQIRNIILGNITWIIFAIFLLSGLFRGGDKNEEQQEAQRQQREAQQRRAQTSTDNRPLMERMAEAMGMQEVMEEVKREQEAQRADPQRRGRADRQGRRSTTTGNVQDNYPELFGGSSLFADKDDQWGAGKTKWGFDETEWGSTFERSEDQWGNTFPTRKSSEPTIEWPS